MRIRLYREGHATGDGRILKASTWAPEPLPVMAYSPRRKESVVVGTLRHLRRDTTSGWVTGILQTRLDCKGLAAEADFDEVEVDEEASTEDLGVFRTARFRGIHLGTAPTWDDMWIKEEEK